MRPTDQIRRDVLQPCMEPIEARLMLSAALDPSFGDAGIAIHDLGADAQIEAMLVHGDKILVAGTAGSGAASEMLLARFDLTGALDATFGAGGLVRLNAGLYSRANALAIDPDGRIVVAGEAMPSTHFDYAVARFHANGTLDSSFGTGGVVRTDFTGGLDRATAVAILDGGQILVAGTAGANRFALARYETDGTLDQTFSGYGMLTQGVAGYNVRLNDMLLAGGSIVAVGEAYNTATDRSDFAVMKFAADGALDASFDGDGVAILDLGSAEEKAHTVAASPDGTFIVAGESGGSFAIARITANGAFDPAFGTNGCVITDVSGGDDVAHQVLVDGVGNLVAVGDADWELDFAMVRYSATGELIETVMQDVGSDYEGARSGALLPGGQLVVGGFTYGSSSNMALVKFAFEPVAPPVNTIPTVTVAGPTGAVTGTTLSFVATIDDPDADDVHQISWNFGDGSVVEYDAGALSMTHVYLSPGTYVVQVTVRDASGAEATSEHAVQVVAPIGLQTNEDDPTKTDLVVVGTEGNDVIQVRPQGKDQWVVVVNGTIVGVFNPTGEILVDGGGGDDEIIVSKKPLAPGKKK